jgi:flagellar assembly protein FliH
MNSFKGFTAEELAALSPWRLPVVGEGQPEQPASEALRSVSVVEEEVEAAPMLTAQEIEAMQRQAYEEAAQQGRAEGREQGHREGYEEGRRLGYAEGQEEVKTLSGVLEALMVALNEPLLEVDEQVEHELVALAVALARQLIRRELRTDPGQIIAVVREALAILPSNARRVSLHLHPDDAELVRAALSLDEGGQRWKIIEDPLLTRGGCRVTSETSAVDASVEKRLAAVIAKAFGGERGGDHQ